MIFSTLYQFETMQPHNPMNEITKLSYAKVNLFLDILGIRANGYHDLCMVNAKISLHDTLTLQHTESNSITITSNLDDIPLDETNTAHKAAKRFMDTAGISHGIAIHLEKNIPHGAGLGGGSSNAAVTLQALNEMNGNPLTHEQLSEIGVGIGADVPFFLYDRACHILGIGESITELVYDASAIHPPHLVLVSPPVPVATGKAYKLWDESAMQLHLNVEPMIACIQQMRLDELHHHIFNSFEPVIYSAYPQINQVYQDFCEICPTRPLLSGSGSNLFALLNEEDEAERVMAVLCKRGYTAQICRLML